jgi:hypothetical protein
MKGQHKENLKTKDDEIERLVEEKKELQGLLFRGTLLSTLGTSPNDGGKEVEAAPKDQTAAEAGQGERKSEPGGDDKKKGQSPGKKGQRENKK